MASDLDSHNRFRQRLGRPVATPRLGRLQGVVSRLSPAERIVFGIIVTVFAASALVVLYRVNSLLMVEVPASGGTLTEGIVGTARFINPLLSISDADRDLTSLVYSGLLRATPEGELIPDLAENYSISEDGLVYTFTLKSDVTFQDGTPVTARDVVFTVEKALDPTLKSPRRANWEGITVELVDERTVAFHLKAAYAPFLENATMGILPAHLWEAIPSDQFSFSDYNVSPIGSGPYKVADVSRTAAGIPTSYDLVPFSDYALGEAFISKLRIRFYTGEDDQIAALQKGEIDSVAAISPHSLTGLQGESDIEVLKYPLPRIFGVFFNQNQAPIFTHPEVRAALNAAVPKDEIIDTVLSGYGSVIDSPLPPYVLEPVQTSTSSVSTAISTSTATTTLASTEDRIAKAKGILERNGWKWNEEEKVYEKQKSKKEVEKLSFSLSTASTPELKQTAEILKREWDKLGVDVTLKIFETGDLNQNVIRPRQYDSLLFGEIVGRELDLFAFWHSSQRNDPGLNIALYTNKDADKYLQTARGSSDEKVRLDAYEKFAALTRAETPAIFLYSPDFIYIVPQKLEGVELGLVTTPSERFIGINRWYLETDQVWNFFANN